MVIGSVIENPRMSTMPSMIRPAPFRKLIALKTYVHLLVGGFASIYLLYNSMGKSFVESLKDEFICGG